MTSIAQTNVRHWNNDRDSISVLALLATNTWSTWLLHTMESKATRTRCNARVCSAFQRCSTSQRSRLALRKCVPTAPHLSYNSIPSSSTPNAQLQQQLLDLPVTTTAAVAATASAAHCAEHGRAAAATIQHQRRIQQQQQRLTSSTMQLLAAAVAATAVQLLTAGSAAAAKIEVEVPDFLVENNPVDVVLHSPVFAIAIAVLALILFPKLIRTTINYLLYPAIVALLAYLAISHPEETASSIYYLLEFIKDHPAASSVAVIAAAGVLLGPDVLAGTAVAGVLLLLAAQAGLLQLPKPPELPKLPGQQVVAKQLGKAGKALQQRVEELDEGRPLLPAAVLSRQQRWQHEQLEGYSSSGGRGKQEVDRHSQGGRDQDEFQTLQDASSMNEEATYVPQQQQRQQLQPQSKAAAMPEATTLSQQQQQLGEDMEAQQSAERVFESMQGIGQKLGTAGKGLVRKAKEVLPKHEQIQAGLNTAKSGLLSATQEVGSRVQGFGEQLQRSGLGPKIQDAGKELGSRVQGLGEKVQQSGLGSRVQDVKERAGAAAAGALGKLRQGLQQQQQQVPLPQPSGAKQQGTSQQQQQQQQVEVAAAPADSSSAVAAAGVPAADGEDSSRVDSILANS